MKMHYRVTGTENCGLMVSPRNLATLTATTATTTTVKKPTAAEVVGALAVAVKFVILLLLLLDLVIDLMQNRIVAAVAEGAAAMTKP